MKKFLKNKKKIVMLFILIFVFFSINVYASADYSIGGIFSDAQNFLDIAETPGSKINIEALKDTSSFLFNLLFSIGMVVAVVVGVVLGIQFMVASAEDKAKVKESLIAYVVGCIVLFGGYEIWNVVVRLIQTITKV